MILNQGFGKKVWVAFFLIASALVPAPVRAVDGRSNLDETVLFRWISTEDRYAQVSPAEIQPKNLYLRWDNREQRYVWVTGDNRHMILSKTKVQGARIGYVGTNAKNWFQYSELDVPAWTKNTERTRPEVWRWDPTRVVGGSWTTGTYVSERAGNGWETWGGELDPITPPVVDPPKPPVVDPPKPPVVDPPVVKPPVVDPPVVKPPVVDPPPVKPPVVDPPPVKPPSPDELGCTIEGPTSAPAGSTVILTMKTTGKVYSANLNGAAVDFPMVMRSWTAERAVGTATPNEVTIKGSVRGERGSYTECKIKIQIAN